MRRIKLTQGKFAIVDDDMYDYLKQWKWYAVAHGSTHYVVRRVTVVSRNGKRRGTIFMHRVVLKTPDKTYTDHKNHNGLDNRIANLRPCTTAQNQYNQKPRVGCTSKYKGVYWSKYGWRAQVYHNGKTGFLGHYEDETVAAKAYDARARELFGEYACTNL